MSNVIPLFKDSFEQARHCDGGLIDTYIDVAARRLDVDPVEIKTIFKTAFLCGRLFQLEQGENK